VTPPLYHQLTPDNVHLGASLIAPPSTLSEMLQFAAEKQIKPWIQTYPMDEVNKAIVDMKNGKARYRLVLVNQVPEARL
jgi:alcohol dehydrogenase (NADP+)